MPDQLPDVQGDVGVQEAMPVTLFRQVAGVATPVGDGTTPLVVLNGAATTAAQTSVNSGTSAVTILAANASRKAASITNTDANPLYLLLGSGTPSATNYTAKLVTDAYYEVPGGYTGIVKGIWAADGSGVALVTELT